MVHYVQSSSRMPPSHLGTTACLIVLGWVLVRPSFRLRGLRACPCTLPQSVA